MLSTSNDIPPDAENFSALVSRWAIFTFLVLFTMNLLDYVDRNILNSVLIQVQSELRINDMLAGLLTTLFLVTLSVVSPVIGWFADRWRRTWILGIGVGVWGIATVGTGLARNYGQLVTARCFLGIGEATYGVIAPTLLMDLFSRQVRARVMSAFYLAMPIGTALGIGLGGTIATRLNWHAAFFIVGLPAVLAAFAAFGLPEPIRGVSEGIDLVRLRHHEQAGATKEDYLDMMVNSSYTYTVFGMAAYTFAIGGLVVWVPKFLTITRGIPQERATWLLGFTTLAAAVIGMLLGGWVADRWSRTNPRALFVVPGVAMLAAIPFVLVGMLATTPVWIFAGIFFAEMLMFVNTGPCNAIIANVVAPNMRAAAYAAATFAIHFLGDIWSPALIGWLSDTFGQKDTMETVFGQALAAIGAVPTPSPHGQPANLLAGMLAVVPAILISGLVLLSGARHLPREMALMLAKLNAAPVKPCLEPDLPAAGSGT